MKVSVVVITYNHAAYIDMALESVIAQRTDFDFEIIISEDASTDGTREIVQSWRERYPDRIRLILSPANVRSNQVVARGIMAARGEYVALLDGDDFWTSPHKLQTQAEVMERDQSLAMCFTNACTIGEGNADLGKPWTSPSLKPRLSIDDLWDGNPFATCGSLFRRACVPSIPGWYDDFFPVTDWPLYILFAEHGDIAYLPDVMGAYRLHDGGLYSSQPQEMKLASMDKLYRKLDTCFEGRYRDKIRSGHRRYFIDWTKAYLESGSLALARTALDYAKRSGPAKTPAQWSESLLLRAKLMLSGTDKGKP